MNEGAAHQPLCVITGGSSGIGLAASLRFADLGYRLVICGRDENKLQHAKDQITARPAECLAVPMDVAVPACASQLVEQATKAYGRVDVLVNNAGKAPLSPLEEMSKEEFDAALRVNIEAVFHTTQAVWPVMKKQRSGVIINISSMASVDPFTGFSVYGACKAWVNLFTKAIAGEGKPHGIRVYSVAPGAVETGMLRGLFPDFPKDRTLAADEVADFLCTLCNASTKHAAGQTFFLRK